MRLRSRSRLAVLTSLVLVLGFARAPHAQAAATIDLATLRDTLVAQTPAGSAGVIDPATGRVVLKLAGEPSAKLKAHIARYPGLVQTQRTAPIARTLAIYGGLGISSKSGGMQCTAGFIATRPGVANYVITAGHCVREEKPWERKQAYLGDREANWVYGERGDFGLIKIKGVHMTPYGWINTPTGPISVTGSRGGEFQRGQSLCHMGNATKLRCGTVTNYGVTVNYDDGLFNPPITVAGLVEMDMCVLAGDSGGPLFSDDGVNVFGWGIISGGTDLPCSDPGFRGYYQPLQEVLEYYGDLPLRVG